jgi:hypothetical protein
MLIVRLPLILNPVRNDFSGAFRYSPCDTYDPTRRSRNLLPFATDISDILTRHTFPDGSISIHPSVPHAAMHVFLWPILLQKEFRP